MRRTVARSDKMNDDEDRRRVADELTADAGGLGMVYCFVRGPVRR